MIRTGITEAVVINDRGFFVRGDVVRRQITFTVKAFQDKMILDKIIKP